MLGDSSDDNVPLAAVKKEVKVKAEESESESDDDDDDDDDDDEPSKPAAVKEEDDE